MSLLKNLIEAIEKCDKAKDDIYKNVKLKKEYLICIHEDGDVSIFKHHDSPSIKIGRYRIGIVCDPEFVISVINTINGENLPDEAKVEIKTKLKKALSHFSEHGLVKSNVGNCTCSKCGGHSNGAYLVGDKLYCSTICLFEDEHEIPEFKEEHEIKFDLLVNNDLPF